MALSFGKLNNKKKCEASAFVGQILINSPDVLNSSIILLRQHLSIWAAQIPEFLWKNTSTSMSAISIFFEQFDTSLSQMLTKFSIPGLISLVINTKHPPHIRANVPSHNITSLVNVCFTDSKRFKYSPIYANNSIQLQCLTRFFSLTQTCKDWLVRVTLWLFNIAMENPL